jgi:hypothetical protein
MVIFLFSYPIYEPSQCTSPSLFHVCKFQNFNSIASLSPHSPLRACVHLSNGTHYPNIADFASQAHPRLLGSNKPTYKRPRSVCWKERPGSKNKNGLRFFFSESTINYHPRVCISVWKEKKSTFKITLMWFRIWVSWEFS